MRISDWSSDVCSSDLPSRVLATGIGLCLQRQQPLAIGQDLLVGPQHQRAESAEKDALLLNHLDILAVDLPVLADVHQVDARDLADARLPSLWRVVQVLEELEQRLGAGDFEAFRMEEQPSELQSLMRSSYAYFS